MLLTSDTIQHFSDWFTLDFAELVKFEAPAHPHTNKSIIISDVHAPFEHEIALNNIKNIEADNLLIIGDWFDMYSLSRFKKHTNPPIHFEWEFREAYTRLVEICKCFPSVSLMITNHDNRADKYLYDNAPKEIIGFCRTGIIQDLIRLIPNINIVEQKNIRGFNYVWQYKDIVFTHIEKSSIQDSKILEDIEKHLHNWKDVYKLNEYNCIIQAHNHRAAYSRQGNKHCFLNPCLIDINKPAFDYVFNGKCYGKPPTIGYMEIQFTNDKFDFSRSRQVIIENNRIHTDTKVNGFDNIDSEIDL